MLLNWYVYTKVSIPLIICTNFIYFFPVCHYRNLYGWLRHTELDGNWSGILILGQISCLQKVSQIVFLKSQKSTIHDKTPKSSPRFKSHLVRQLPSGIYIDIFIWSLEIPKQVITAKYLLKDHLVCQFFSCIVNIFNVSASLEESPDYLGRWSRQIFSVGLSLHPLLGLNEQSPWYL